MVFGAADSECFHPMFVRDAAHIGPEARLYAQRDGSPTILR